jgi:hypothetical protein
VQPGPYTKRCCADKRQKARETQRSGVCSDPNRDLSLLLSGGGVVSHAPPPLSCVDPSPRLASHSLRPLSRRGAPVVLRKIFLLFRYQGGMAYPYLGHGLGLVGRSTISSEAQSENLKIQNLKIQKSQYRTLTARRTSATCAHKSFSE